MIGPFLVEIIEVEITTLSPEELEEKMQSAVAGLRYIPVKEAQQEEKAKSGIKKLHTDVLLSYAKEWWMPENKRCESLSLHPEYFGRIVKDLQGMGFLGEKQYFGYGKGKPSATCFVTEKGAGMLGIPYSQTVPPGKGSAAHRFLQNLLAEKLKGVVEYAGADVVEYRTNGSVAYEIELDPSDEHFLKNIERDLSTFSMVVVVARSQKDLTALKSRAENWFLEDTLGEVEFKTVKEVLESG